MESSEQTIRRLQRELKQKDTAIKQKDTAIKQKDTAIKQNNRAIKQNNRAIRQKDAAISRREKTIGLLREQLLLREDGLWAVTDAGRSDTDTSLLHIREVIHGILHNSAKLAGITSYDLDQFDYICNDFVAESKRHNKDAPLFSEDETPDPGNRCLPGRRSVLLMALFRKRSNVTQDALGVLFDVDQSTVCRYLKFADSVLAGILPTADRMTRLVKKAETSEQLEQLMPDRTIIIDGTEAVPRQRPQDRDKRKNTYSGKKKRFTINTAITTNRAGPDTCSRQVL